MSISHPKFTIGAIASLAVLLSSSLVVAQTTYKEVVQSQEVRPLPGKLDNILVFNSAIVLKALRRSVQSFHSFN